MTAALALLIYSDAVLSRRLERRLLPNSNPPECDHEQAQDHR